MPTEIETYLREHHPAAADLALWTCETVGAADPDLAPRVYRGWQGVGFRHPEVGYICGVFPRSESVRVLFEHGTSMADPAGVLQGDGAQTRFISITEPNDVTAHVIVRYVQQAVAERLLAN